MAAVVPAVILLMFVCIPSSESAIITQDPQSSEYTEGSSVAYLFCILDKLGENAIKFWEKGSKQITSDTTKYEFEFKKSGQYGLSIMSIERSDEQDYVCGVTDDGNTVKSMPARLTVREVPSERYPRIELKEQYRAGVSATISCMSEDTDPRPELMLFRSGNKDPVSTKWVAEMDILRISHLFTPTTDDNAAVFSCKMTSPDLKQENFVRVRNASINVQFAPIISIKHEQVIDVGKIAILICETTASNPEATEYEWKEKHGSEFTDNFVINGKIMQIENPTEYLNGTVLVCSARNSIGRTEKDVTLYVRGLDSTSFDRSSTIPDTGQSNTEQKSMDILLKTVIIAGIITISVITLLVLPLCLHHMCINRHAIDSMGRKISQPQIYFESHDRILPTPPENMDNYTWKRSLAVQVPDDLEIDIELVYQEISEKSRINRNTLAKTTSTYS